MILKKNIFILLVLFPFILLSQETWLQIGQDIDGESQGDLFGRNIILSGDGQTLAAFSLYNSTEGVNTGQVRVFRNEENNWVQVGESIYGEDSHDLLGESLSISYDGSVLALAASPRGGGTIKDGYVKVYKNINDNWVPFGSTIRGSGFGSAVSLNADGTVLAFDRRGSAQSEWGSGGIVIYQNYGITIDNWVQIGSIDGLYRLEQLGNKVHLNKVGDIVVASGNVGTSELINNGHLRAFKYINNDWIQLGNDITGTNEFDLLGSSFDLDATGLKIVASTEDPQDGANLGKVKIFEFYDEAWHNTQIFDDFGGKTHAKSAVVSLSDDGNILAIGDISEKSITELGRPTRVFKKTNDLWTQVGESIFGRNEDDFSGSEVSISADGSTIAIGAHLSDSNGTESGQVRVHTISSDVLSIETISLPNNDTQLNIKNPIFDVLEINTNRNDITKITLLDVYGKIVFESSSNQNKYNIQYLEPAMYILNVEFKEEYSFITKVIKR